MKRFIISSAAVAMSLTMAVQAVAAEGDSKYFKDVTATNYGWAVEYIDYIAKNGIASGVGSDMYAPGSNIIRGDFAILVDKTFNFKPAKLITYSLKDVPEDSYYAQAIANGCGGGVITERGMFYPENDITRIDAIVMIYRALTNNKLISGGLTTDTSVFSDRALITTAERQAAVGTLYKLGIISGDDKGNLNPDNTMTRAEMAVVFAKLDKYIEEYNIKAAQDAEDKAQQEKEEEIKKEEEKKEEDKVNESRDYNSEDVKEPIIASNGGTISISDSTVNVSGDNGITAENKSEIDIKNTSVKAVGGDGVSVGDDSKINIKGGSVKGTNGNGISAKDGAVVNVDGTEISALGTDPKYGISVDGANIKVKNADIEAAENKSAILVSGKSNLDLSDSSISASTGSGKSTYTGAIDILSADESVINVENTTIDNKKGAAFYIRESNATINIKSGNKINAAMLINSPKINKEPQKEGNNITLNLEDGVRMENTRIEIDNKTVLNINIEDNASFGGQIDPNMNGYINLEMSQNATLFLDNDLYLDGFKNESSLDFDNIISNGFNIYYNESNPDNEYLQLKRYDLLFGGRLMPYTMPPME